MIFKFVLQMKKSKKYIEKEVLEREVNNVLQDEQAQEEDLQRKQRSFDHELIQIQYCLLKIFEFCSSELMNNSELMNIVDELAYESQRLLAHEHNWVRCNAAKIITHILSGYDFAYIGQKLSQIEINDNVANSIKFDYIYLNPEYDIKALILDLCAQMIPAETPQPMIDEIVKIFLYVATMLKDVPFTVNGESIEEDEKQNDSKDSLTKINLNWLLRNIRFLINKEVVKAPHCTSMVNIYIPEIFLLILFFSEQILSFIFSERLYLLSWKVLSRS